MTRYVVYDVERFQYLARWNGGEPIWTDDKLKARVWRYPNAAQDALQRVQLVEPNNKNLIVTEQ